MLCLKKTISSNTQCIFFEDKIPFPPKFQTECTLLAKKISELYKDSKDTLLLFIGASPAYIHLAFSKLETPCESRLLPISGLSLIYTKDYMLEPLNSSNKKDAFTSYVEKFITRPYKKIVLVDHSHTGMSILNLIKLLRECEINSTFDFINLVDEKTPLNYIDTIPYFGYLQQNHILKGEFINQVSGHKIARLCPQHHLINILKQEEIDQKSTAIAQLTAEKYFFKTYF
ncbi:MAG: hypothetical protein ACON35_05955 [Candidatus Marinamargulisbacteria bacterium]